MSVTVDSPPPQLEIDLGGGGSDWVSLTRARHDIEAHLIMGRLGEAGIDVRFVKDRTAPGAWLYGGSNPWAPVEVFVKRYHHEDASVLLAEISFQAPAARAPRPPSGRSALVWWAVALALGLVFTGASLAQIKDQLSLCRIGVLCERHPVP